MNTVFPALFNPSFSIEPSRRASRSRARNFATRARNSPASRALAGQPVHHRRPRCYDEGGAVDRVDAGGEHLDAGAGAADELLEGLDTLTEWPEKVVVMQRNWIGRSEGARVKFPSRGTVTRIEVFTTRIDTISARPSSCSRRSTAGRPFASESPDPTAFRDRVREVPRAGPRGAPDGAIEKEGFDTGRKAINPFTGQEVPIWIANFVLAEYGTGAIMAVPAHDQRDFEFARKYQLPIRVVVQSGDQPATRRRR